MKLLKLLIGILCVFPANTVLSTLTGKNKHHIKQFTLSCTGMDYSARKQRMHQNENEVVSDTFKGLYPEGQEVLYTYSAVITTGTKSPAHFVSQFNLTGNIKVQGFKDKARIQFYSLKYNMYSGDFLAEKKSKWAPLPGSSSSLYEPFDIIYKEGEVLKLEIPSGTPQWSISIKKALGSVLQLDLPKIVTDKFSSFVSTEQCIHGNCAVLYSVKPLKNKLHITKFYSLNDCQRETMEWTNLEPDPMCLTEEFQNDKLESYSQKTYRVTPYSNDTLLIREVFSEGKTFRLLNRNSNNSHYITVSQKLQLVSMNGIARTASIPNAEEVNTLEFDAAQFNSFKFSTNEDLKSVVNKVHHLIPSVRSELEAKNNLLSEQVNPQESHLVPLLITYLRKLDLTLLKQIYNQLEKKNDVSSMAMFIKILPLVGSKDSALFTVKLIKDKKVVNYDAELMVSSLPFHIRQVSEEHLTEFEDLLHLPESTKSTLRNAAVLSFATLVYKTCKVNRCKPEIIEKYTLHYLENSNEYLKQLVYLAGLSNLHLENNAEFFGPMILEEEPVSSESVKVLGLRALFPVVATNPVKAYEIYWPVLINRENSLELRSTALVLLLEAQQEHSIYMQLHQFLKADDTSTHLYNIYYKLMKEYSEENCNCHLTRTQIAQKIMRSIRRPVTSQFLSSHYTISIRDGKLRALVIVSPQIEDGISLYFTYASKLSDNPLTYYSVYIKLKGIEGEIVNNIMQTVFDSLNAEEILKQFIQNELISENFELEFILFYQQQVITLRSYDKSNVEELLKDLIHVRADDFAKLTFLHATSFSNMETFFVTDIGFPGVLSLDHPNLMSIHSQATTGDSTPDKDMDATFDLRYWSQGSAVLKVKNTMVDIWQGIVNSHSSRYSLPLNLGIDFKNQLNWRFKEGSDKENTLMGYKWHAQIDIFTVSNREGYDALTASCQDCKSTSTVKRKTAKTVEHELHDGYKLYSKIFDCEDDGTTSLLKSVTHFDSPNIFHTLGTLLSAGFFLGKGLLELPILGSCGYSTVYAPNFEYTTCVEATYKRHNLTFMIGSSEPINEDCISDNVVISLALDESSEHLSYDEEQLKGECKRKLAAGFEAKLKQQFKKKVGTCGATTGNGHAENLEWCEKEMKPQIMSCMQSEMLKKDKETIKISLKIKKMPSDIENTVTRLVSDFMETHINNISGEIRGEKEEETEALIVFDFVKSKYSISLHLPHKYFVLTDTFS